MQVALRQREHNIRKQKKTHKKWKFCNKSVHYRRGKYGLGNFVRREFYRRFRMREACLS